jgi:hypothetical protein
MQPPAPPKKVSAKEHRDIFFREQEDVFFAHALKIYWIARSRKTG